MKVQALDAGNVKVLYLIFTILHNSDQRSHEVMGTRSICNREVRGCMLGIGKLRFQFDMQDQVGKQTFAERYLNLLLLLAT